MKSWGKGMTKVLMILLSLLPILNIYMSPIPGFAIGSFLILLAIIYMAIKKNDTKQFYWPLSYIWFWIYVAFSFFVSSISSGYIYRAIIPGGVSFFVFSILFGFCINKMDLHLFHKYIKIVAYICISVFLLQEFFVLTVGTRFSALIPFLQMTDGVPTDILILIQKNADRSCSLFREPAHFGQFLLIALALDMFIEEGKRKISIFSIISIVTLLFIRSGNGLLGLIVLTTLKVFAIMRGRNSKYKYVVILLIPLSLVWILPYYMRTEAAQYMVSRSNELTIDEESRSYVRIYRGYALYETLPLINKLIGSDSEGLLDATRNSGVSAHFSGDRNSDLYFNGVQHILLSTGVIGIILFLVFIVPYYKKASYLGKSSLLTLLALSFVSSMYLSHIMLLFFLIAITDARINVWKKYN